VVEELELELGDILRVRYVGKGRQGEGNKVTALAMLN